MTWRVEGSTSDCARSGPGNVCFCGHTMSQHDINLKTNTFGCEEPACRCTEFCYVPTCPEEVGEWWMNVDGTRKAQHKTTAPKLSLRKTGHTSDPQIEAILASLERPTSILADGETEADLAHAAPHGAAAAASDAEARSALVGLPVHGMFLHSQFIVWLLYICMRSHRAHIAGVC